MKRKAQTSKKTKSAACPYYLFASGFAASVMGLGLGVAFGFGAQKSGEAAATSAGGLLRSGRKWLMIVSDPCTESATTFK